jgi:hypothetical protein
MDTNNILELAALVASFVGVAKRYGLRNQHSPLLALIIATVFVLVPDEIQEKIVMISVIGLTASGAYHYTKKQENLPLDSTIKENRSTNKSKPTKEEQPVDPLD